MTLGWCWNKNTFSPYCQNHYGITIWICFHILYLILSQAQVLANAFRCNTLDKAQDCAPLYLKWGCLTWKQGVHLMVCPTFHRNQSSNKEGVRLEDFPLSALNTAPVQPAGTACQMIACSVFKFSWNAHEENPTSLDFLPPYALRNCATKYCNKKP